MKKIGYIALAAIVIVATIIVATIGFNVDVSYSDHKEMRVSLGKEYNLSEVYNIAQEVMGKESVAIAGIEKFNDAFVIKAKNMSDEQVQSLTDKIAEKYEISEEKKSSLATVTYVPGYRIRDMVEPFILPAIISSIAILVYMAFKYKKLGMVKAVVGQFGIMVFAEILLVSVYAIARIPVNRLFVPAMLAVYVLSVIACNVQFAKQLEEKKEEVKN